MKVEASKGDEAAGTRGTESLLSPAAAKAALPETKNQDKEQRRSTEGIPEPEKKATIPGGKVTSTKLIIKAAPEKKVAEKKAIETVVPKLPPAEVVVEKTEEPVPVVDAVEVTQPQST